MLFLDRLRPLLLNGGQCSLCLRLHDRLSWLHWHGIDILVEINVIQRRVVYAQSVGLNAGQQHESPLVGNANVSHSFRRYAQAVEQLIVFNVPHSQVVLAHCKEMFGVELTEGKMRNTLRVSTSLGDALEGF